MVRKLGFYATNETHSGTSDIIVVEITTTHVL